MQDAGPISDKRSKGDRKSRSKSTSRDVSEGMD